MLLSKKSFSIEFANKDVEVKKILTYELDDHNT